MIWRMELLKFILIRNYIDGLPDNPLILNLELDNKVLKAMLNEILEVERMFPA